MNPGRPGTLADPAKSGAAWLLIVAGGILSLGEATAADVPPDLELLEYLGSWEDAEEDWVLFGNTEDRGTPEDTKGETAEDGDELQESDDES